MNKLFSSLLVSSALLTGCASTTKVTEDKYSGFLNDYSILKPNPDDKHALYYINPDINWQQYNSVMVDKVLVITPDGELQTDAKLLVAIADKFQQLIKQKLSKNFTVVDHAGAGTARLQAAITSVYSSYDDLKGYQYIPIAAAVTGVARASGSEKQSVRVMTEVKLLDSVDGQVLGQLVDLKSGKEKQNKDSEISVSDVIPILEQWAQRFADRLENLKKHAQSK